MPNEWFSFPFIPGSSRSPSFLITLLLLYALYYVIREAVPLVYCYGKEAIGLFKMFSNCIWGIFNIQIQSDRGHKLMLFIVQNKDKDLLGIYQYTCDPFYVSLITDRHLKVRSNCILSTFRTKARFSLRVTHSITRCTQ